MTDLSSHPPIPTKLREVLRDYPEHLRSLQDDLIAVARKPSTTPAYERAVWILESALETFISEARRELNDAQATGDSMAIEAAKAKRSAFGSARTELVGLSGLRAYFSNWMNNEASRTFHHDRKP